MRKQLLLSVLALLLPLTMQAENIIQAFQTTADSTITYLYSQEVLKVGDTFKGKSVDAVWTGDDVTLRTAKQNPHVSSEYGYGLWREVKTVVFDESFRDAPITTTASWFRECALTTIKGIENLNTSNVTDMSRMFCMCKNLKKLDLSGLDTKNVTNMEDMFGACNNLTELNISGFDTRNVTNMKDMFYYCSSLTTVDVSNFNTESVTDMSSMFYYCTSLTSIDVTNFNTQNTYYMSRMFEGCSSLAILDLTSFSGVSIPIRNCNALIFVSVSRPQFANYSNIVIKQEDNSFVCNSLLPLAGVEYDIPYTFTATMSTDTPTKFGYRFEKWNTKADGTGTDYLPGQTDAVVEKGKVCFYEIWEKKPLFYTLWSAADSEATYLYTLDELQVGDTFKGKSIDALATEEELTGTNAQAQAILRNATTVVLDETLQNAPVISIAGWFSGCRKLTSISGLEYLNTTGVTNMSSLFYGCTSLSSLDVSHFDTKNVTNMASMFYNCSSLTSLDVSHFDTKNVTDMSNMFRNCSSLTSLDVSGFNTENVTILSGMFRNCSSLTSLDVSGFNTENVTNLTRMFESCNRLRALDLTSFYTINKSTNRMLPANALLYMTDSITNSSLLAQRDNNLVIKHGEGSYTCDSLVLHERQMIDIPIGFKAKAVTVDSTYAAGTMAHNLMLPYKAVLPKDAKAYTLATEQNTPSTVTFVEVSKDTLQAYTPYLLVSEENDMSFSRTEDDYTIDVLPTTTEPVATSAAGFTLSGTMSEKSGEQIYKLNDNTWLPLSSEETIAPMNAYLISTGGEAQLSCLFSKDAPTQIKAINRDGTATYYDMRGIKVTSPQKGLHLIRHADGTTRKVVIK